MSGPEQENRTEKATRLNGSVLALRAGTELVPVAAPKGASAAGYVRLTSHILLKAKLSPFRSLGVISAHDGEGKTMTAINLAACLGRTHGRIGRILLVDGDIRGRTLSRMLAGKDEEPSVRPVNGRVGTPRLRLTDFEGVDLLTAPETGEDATLHSPELWSAILSAFTTRYSMMIVDCPSVLGRPEGLVLPSCVDQLVLVVKAGITRKQAVANVIRSMNRSVLGVVLNSARAG